ncbi:hypothetical protein QWJ34_16200 [Saccharibacillus sp. CPCC 101409]|uniref:hypothetical protein n=1 Tax=Saccharibacillus sp. CPCC 101409 TaxID=3058041 RepID=UPI00267135AE|nr:hypothetical protein [Saccharibacillus sp. CPCC 101409]MDO3411308.1 hypothetical protein [Saccharibacillus sp. CPCC 101409]
MFKKIVDKIAHSAGYSSHSNSRRGSGSKRPKYSRSSSSDYRHGGQGRYGHSYYKNKSRSSS